MRARTFVSLFLLVGLASVPLYAGFAVQRLLVEVYTVLAIATAWNLLAGLGGMVVIGQHAFVGMGAYALFYFCGPLGAGLHVALPAACLVTAAFAVGVAPIFLRLSGAQLAVGSWVLAELLRICALNSDLLGAGGGMPMTALQDLTRSERNALVYGLALAVGVLAILVARTMTKSRIGLALASIRDSEAAARACGVDAWRAKFVLWVVCATITAGAGAVAYMNTLQVTPDASFGLQWTAIAIFIAVIGGIGRVEGPLVGTALYFALREGAASFGAWYFVALGLLAIATMLAAPGGAWSLVQRRWPKLDVFDLGRRMP